MQTTITNNTAIANREHWLIEAANMLEQMIFTPAITTLGEQLPMPLTYSVSIGNPKAKNAIGECWYKERSADKVTSHIFIAPSINNSLEVLATLLHEMIHAADDCQSGHLNFFARVARKCGLQGKLTATHAGDGQLKETLLDIVDALGDIPHSPLDTSVSAKPKQKARMLKIECPECAFTFRASRTQINRVYTSGSSAPCPCCTESMLDAVCDLLMSTGA